MKVLVTGHDGFIGRNLVEHLQAAGHETQGQSSCFQFRERHDAIIHLSALSGIPACQHDPLSAYHSNIRQTFDLLECARQFSPAAHFIFTSSRAVEAAPLSLYGATKLACEALVRGYADSFGLRATVLRLASVYGPHSGHKRSVAAQFIFQALHGLPLTINGDGTQTRDFLFVGDATETIMGLLREGPRPLVTLCGPREVSVNDLAGMVETGFGREPSRSYSGPLESRRRRTAGTAVVRGWTTLEEGLGRTIAWFREYDRIPSEAS